jgi:hypothetical protein
MKVKVAADMYIISVTIKVQNRRAIPIHNPTGKKRPENP